MSPELVHPATLVDSSVLLDVLTEDPTWFPWSSAAMARAADRGPLWINPLIFTEVSVRFTRIEDLDVALPASEIERRPLPWEAAFLAGKAFVRYRQAGGTRPSPLPDFFIGAHAAVTKVRLLTRDPSRVRTHFPTVHLDAP